jgi:HK97 gp10 family phage protein
MADGLVVGKMALNRKLGLLSDAFKAAATEALSKSADDIVASMKRLVPVDQGDLRDSIAWTFGEAPKGATTFFNSRPIRSANNLRITIYAGNDKAFYARWVEFGTLPHVNGGSRSGSQNPGTNARPFFYPLTRTLNKEAKRIAAT